MLRLVYIHFKQVSLEMIKTKTHKMWYIALDTIANGYHLGKYLKWLLSVDHILSPSVHNSVWFNDLIVLLVIYLIVYLDASNFDT